MGYVADSFKPPCLLGHYPCMSSPSSEDCALIDTCSKDLFFCKFAKLAYPDGTDISCKVYSFNNRNCTHGSGSCSRRAVLEHRCFGGL